MKVEGPKGPSQVGKTGGAKRAGQTGGFSKIMESLGTQESAAASGPSGVGAMDGLFMLQTVSDEERKKRAQAKARAEAGLTLLDQITYALLNSAVSTAHLARLKALAGAQTDQVADPRLAAVLDEIDLRLAVEAAKLEKASESAHNRS